MLFLIWLLISFALLVCIDIFSFAIGRRGWRRFVGSLILFYALVILSEVTLGLVFLLTGPVLLIVTTLYIVGGVLWLRRKFGTAIFTSYRRETLGSIKSWLAEVKRDKLFVALLVLAVVQLTWLLLLGLLMPVTDVDGNGYHMTFIAQILQNHHIYDTPTSVAWLNGYPKGGEFIQLWNVLIPNNDVAADTAQLPFLVLGVVSLFALAMRLGIKAMDARFVALLFIFSPIVINQAKTTYVDIILSALFLIALALSTQRKIDRFDVLVLGIVFSLMISVKPTGALFVLASLPFLAYGLLVRDRKGKVNLDYRKYIVNLALIIVPVLVGLAWYVKNLFTYGSPLHPFGLTVGGVELFHGETFQDFIATAFTGGSVLPTGMVDKLWFVWTEQQDWFGCLYNYDSTFSGLGPIWFVLLIPSIITAAFIATKKRNYLYLLVALAVTVVFLAYPAHFYSRYVIFITGLGVVSLGLVSSTLGDVSRIISRLVALWLVVMTILTTFTLCNFTPHIIREQLASIRAGHARQSIAYHNAVGPAYVYMQEHVQKNDVVAYDSNPYYIYPLWRADFANKVVYIEASSKSDWHVKAKEQHVTYVFTERTTLEHSWLSKDSSYKSVYKDDLNEIYKLR